MSEYKYGLVYRPPSPGAVPKGYTHYDPSNKGIDGVRHGVLTYDRELTDKEVKDYELKPLMDGKVLHQYPEAVVRKMRETVSTLNYIVEEKMSKEDAGDELEKALKDLKIFEDFSKRKNIDYAQALRELGLNKHYFHGDKIMTSSFANRIKAIANRLAIRSMTFAELDSIPNLPVKRLGPFEGGEVGENTAMFPRLSSAQRFAKFLTLKKAKNIRIGTKDGQVYVFYLANVNYTYNQMLKELS
jgi:hypothetical protein